MLPDHVSIFILLSATVPRRPLSLPLDRGKTCVPGVLEEGGCSIPQLGWGCGDCPNREWSGLGGGEEKGAAGEHVQPGGCGTST